MSDLYHRLGVERTATTEQIKAAFRRLAMQMHPDHGGGREQYDALQKAYEVLRDPERRARYDATGLADEPVDNTDAMAQSLIEQMFLTALSSIDHRTNDLVAVVRQNLMTVEKDINHQRRQAEAALSRMQDAATRIFSAGKRDVLSPILNRQITAVNANIEQLNASIATIKRAMELLSDHGYRTDVPSMSGVTVSTTSGTWSMNRV